MPYSGFKPLIGGGAQRPALPTRPVGSVGPSSGGGGQRPEAASSDPEPRPHDAALRSTFVDKEEAAMLRAMARLNGEDAKSRSLGNRYSQKNVAKQRERAQEAASMGLTAMDPLEQHEMQKKLAANYTKMSERGVRVPKVGIGAPRPRRALIDIVPHRKAEEDIREEHNNYADVQAPRGVPVRSSDERKDELALRNQFYGRTPQEVLANAPPKVPAAAASNRPTSLRGQIEEEVAERQEFIDNMRRFNKLDATTEASIHAEIADRLQDLRTLDRIGGEDDAP